MCLDCDSIYQAKLKSCWTFAYTQLQVRFSRRAARNFELVGADADAHDLPLHEEQVTGTDVRHKCLSDYSIAGDSAVVYLRRRPATAESNGTMYPQPGQPAGFQFRRADSGRGAYATVQNQPGGGGSTGASPRASRRGTITRAALQWVANAGAVGRRSPSRRTGRRTASRQCQKPTCPSCSQHQAHEPVPLCIKYLFDQLDDIARDTSSPETPRISGSPTHRSAPSQRLLFVKEIADFHPKVEAYYAAVRSGIGSRKMNADQVTSRSCSPFCRTALLRELYSEFVYKFQNETLVSVINMLSGHHVAPTLPAPHLHQRRIQHHMMQQQQQQQPFQPHTPLTYQQMQLGPSHHTMGPSSPHNSSYVYPTMSSVNSSNRSILHTFGQHDPYA
uniref:Plexin_cytopl domain-containing protein n=1 Tax=Macrostomum lignano TaxID=282301 RepID=A0A1I8F418_9PLAT